MERFKDLILDFIFYEMKRVVVMFILVWVGEGSLLGCKFLIYGIF